MVIRDARKSSRLQVKDSAFAGELIIEMYREVGFLGVKMRNWISCFIAKSEIPILRRKSRFLIDSTQRLR